MRSKNPERNRGSTMMTLRTPFLAAALLTSVAAVGLSPALAQNTPAPATSEAVQPSRNHHARMLPSPLVDGRVAFLKAELKITPAQETQWQQVATAMHQNATALDGVIGNARQQ